MVYKVKIYNSIIIEIAQLNFNLLYYKQARQNSLLGAYFSNDTQSLASWAHLLHFES